MTASARDAPSSRTRFERIYQTLRTRISLLEHPPGAVLGEAELAAEFGTSRTPVRRVLARLEAEGLVERRHGVGTIVTDVDLEGLRQVYALRVELAGLMGRLAPLDCGPGTLDGLKRCRDRCVGLAETLDPAELARLNLDFHTVLHGTIANEPLREIVDRLYFQTARIWLKSVPKLTLLSEVEIFLRQIDDVIAALEIGDHASVGDVCRMHIAMSFRRMARYAGAADAGKP